jgi:hypothetical protein
MINMKMNIVDQAYSKAKAVSVRNGTKTRPRWPILLLLSVAIGAGGCTGYYGGYASSGPYGPGYAGPGPYGPGYPGSVTVEIGDRPYYTRGAGYYVGRSYYVWVPGHWSRRHPRVWIHGHYVVR